jgi:hypothetical protein
MPMHEHFEELCALAVIGQLSQDEHYEISAHLEHCIACRQASEDFAFILDQLPAGALPSIDGNTANLLSETYRKNFLQRASAEGLRFTDEASSRPHSSFRSWFHRCRSLVAIPVAAICLYALASLLSGGDFKNRIEFKPKSEPKQLAVLPIQVPSKVGGLPPSDGAATTSELERQLNLLKQHEAELLEEKRLLEAESVKLHQQLLAVTQRSEELTAQLQKSGEALSEATAEVDKLKGAQGDILAALGSNRVKIEQLSEKVAEDETALNRERELNAVAKDIRRLMAARNVHIVDVYDYDTRGKRDKSFGRVVYTEGESLIFYAFDLDKVDSASRVTFQAWGQREGSGPTTRNLGVFKVDDHEQKRWVLRVDDSKLLNSIDSVFVTVEPAPRRDKPSGRKLLYAYLGTAANHP